MSMKYYFVPNDKAYTLFIAYHGQVANFEKEYLELVVVKGKSIEEVFLKFDKIGRTANIESN